MMWRMLTVVRGGGTVPSEIATGTFTGEAWRDVLIAPTDGIAVGNVFFAPCSRTYWHSHVGGQLLIVVAGEGHVADENDVVTVRAGDMVWTPPGVRVDQPLPDPHGRHRRRHELGAGGVRRGVRARVTGKPGATIRPAERRVGKAAE